MALNHSYVTSPLSAYYPSRCGSISIVGDTILEDVRNASVLSTDSTGKIVLGSSSSYTPSYIQNLNLTWDQATGHKIDIGTGKCIDSKDSYDIINTSVITGDIRTTGLNGIDAGVFIADRWYYVYILADSNAVNPNGMVFSLSQTVPVLPTGYDKYRRLGVVRSETSAGNFIVSFFQYGKYNTRTYYYDEGVPFVIITGTGNDTTATILDWSPRIPPTSNEAGVVYNFTGTNVKQSFTLPSVEFKTGIQQTILPATTANVANYMTIRVDNNQQTYYKVSNATAKVDFVVWNYQEDL